MVFSVDASSEVAFFKRAIRNSSLGEYPVRAFDFRYSCTRLMPILSPKSSTLSSELPNCSSISARSFSTNPLSKSAIGSLRKEVLSAKKLWQPETVVYQVTQTYLQQTCTERLQNIRVGSTFIPLHFLFIHGIGSKHHHRNM